MESHDPATTGYADLDSTGITTATTTADSCPTYDTTGITTTNTADCTTATASAATAIASGVRVLYE